MFQWWYKILWAETFCSWAHEGSRPAAVSSHSGSQLQAEAEMLTTGLFSYILTLC